MKICAQYHAGCIGHSDYARPGGCYVLSRQPAGRDSLHTTDYFQVALARMLQGEESRI